MIDLVLAVGAGLMAVAAALALREATFQRRLSEELSADVAAAEHRADEWEQAASAVEANRREAEAMLREGWEKALAELQEARAEVERLSIPVITVEPEPLTDEQRRRLIESKCLHCGGAHDIACPRVREIWFRANGTILRASYWAHGEYPVDDIVWLADL